jgi:hypothetical protein
MLPQEFSHYTAELLNDGLILQLHHPLASVRNLIMSGWLAGGPCLIRNFIKLRVPPVPRFWGPGMLNGPPADRASTRAVAGAPGPSHLETRDTTNPMRESFRTTPLTPDP